MFGPGKITAFFVMAFAAILLAAPASAAGVGVKFDSRDPATCTPAQLSGAMTPALARQAFICDTEGLTRTMGVTQSGLTLVANVVNRLPTLGLTHFWCSWGVMRRRSAGPRVGRAWRGRTSGA